jgi:transcriptional regulator of aromatic amino acid metabolism
LLCIETADRPGLLVEIIKIIADVNIDVESAEIDTEVSLLLALPNLMPHTPSGESYFCILF